MDNLTHGFVGVLLAESCLRLRAARTGAEVSSRLRVETFALAIAGNNLPDADIAYARAVGGRAVGYLLQHRGFTHTVPVALLIGAALLAVVIGLRRRARLPLTRGELTLLAIVALLSPLLHVAMDFGNNYGVHPFWPVNSQWFYGDTLFIAEPALWVAILSPLAFSMASRWARLGLWSALGVALAAVWLGHLVAAMAALPLTLAAVVLLALARRMSPGRRAATAVGAFFVTIGAFATGSRQAKALTRAAMASERPQARDVDVSVTPLPADPLCWNVYWVGVEADEYVVRLGRAALAPGRADLPGGRCAFGPEADTTAPMTHLAPPAAGVHPAPPVTFYAEYRRPLAQLGPLAESRCEVAALLQFARVPYVTDPLPDGSRVAGDLRYDRNPELDFADVLVAPKPLPAADCPPNLPPWIPPRTDLLPR